MENKNTMDIDKEIEEYLENRKSDKEKADTASSENENEAQKKETANKRRKERAPHSYHENIGFSERDYFDYAGFKRRKPKIEKNNAAKKVFGRIMAIFASLILFAIIAVYGLCYTIAKGPSPTVRDLLVLSAKQASATKWVPSLFLPKSEVDAILAQSEAVTKDVISLEDYYAVSDSTEGGETDEWENAKDGMLFHTIKGSSYTAYMLIVKDPSRVFVGASSDDFNTSEKGKTIFEITSAYGAVAAINGGEFPDGGGVGTGHRPIGLTYSGGKCVWNDSLKRTFIGFDKDNKLVVSESMTKAQADALGIRDAVSFQTGNVLISSDGENITFYYEDGNKGTAQRTAIGQRADGSVILLVTDGRTASSLGATHNDVIDVMVQYGAVNAAMLDGGSSAMMYYENYYEKYDYDYDSLDQYQKKGLVNKYKAFTTPRHMPTFFMVAPQTEGGADNAN